MIRKLITLLSMVIMSEVLSAQQNSFSGIISEMSQAVSKRLLSTGKKRVAVANFQDLQGNSTELGRYIAESFSVELTNTDLEVVDRSRLQDLIEELKLTDEKLTDPKNALKLGKMAGVEFIITGTTIPLDNVIDITVKALDIEKGITVGGQQKAVPRTDAINNLLRSTIKGGSSNAANLNAARKINADEMSPLDDLFEAKISDLRKSECEVQTGNVLHLLGQVCFENQTGQDLYFTTMGHAPGGWISDIKTPLVAAARNCSPKVEVNNGDRSTTTTEIEFRFFTVNQADLKKGVIRLTVEGCKVKSFVVNKNNLMLMKP